MISGYAIYIGYESLLIYTDFSTFLSALGSMCDARDSAIYTDTWVGYLPLYE